MLIAVEFLRSTLNNLAALVGVLGTCAYESRRRGCFFIKLPIMKRVIYPDSRIKGYLDLGILFCFYATVNKSRSGLIAIPLLRRIA